MVLQFLELAHYENIAPIKKMALLYPKFGTKYGWVSQDGFCAPVIADVSRSDVLYTSR